MDNEIIFEVLKDSEIEQCRQLCDELMKYQQAKAKIGKEVFDNYNFDTRMKPTYNMAGPGNRYVVIVKDKDEVIGYAFSNIEKTENTKKAPVNLLPEWDGLPDKIAHLSNLYLKEEYRGQGIGKKLLEMSLDWINSFPEINLVFVHVSNGNTTAFDFYKHNGFTFSHDVAGGFIQAMYKYIK